MGRQSEKMASRSSDLQAKLREAQETARRQSTEHEVAIGKEISARAHHQKEVKALSKQRTQDLADMVQLEQEVIALTSNFDEDGRYWEILNGEMQLIQDEKDQLQHQVDTLRTEVSQLKVGSTAVAPQEGVDITVKARNPNNPDSPRTPRSLRGVRNFSSANKIDLTSKPS